MPENTVNLYEFNRQDVWAGFKQLVPIAIFVIAFGAAFGLAATQAGLSPSLSMFMSTLVFAGASQFAALELWGTHIPVVPLALTVFAINARHLLMGASLYPWLRYLSPAKRYGIMLVASDANWVMSVQAFHRGQPGFGLLFGGGLALWSFWIFGTWLGIYFGGAIQDATLYGLDMVMGCFLLAMAVGGDKSIRLWIIWAIAAGSALLAYWYLPENSHVVVGALAGGVLGAVWTEKLP
ncbi:Predicted branched-chain amino acid permease (azaleucine resistance) [Halopseudomonas litoralis]|uniref:Predicted branched-chain amino acid permease (Azaleucine resistance) n=1 Tax=Halopseudomonas litoralis TaxID=797277 RepID=A0A1H1V836_9GAMM|nr:AzlC family ABC transporter permease [Halopseudomonas litoralis]SDS80566.1 Predicted branched-chain amino acid permease (azaleucine resistance) [Halopseudomonas litoralis]